MKAGLFQQQTLKMTMTQELTQSIALLQYSTQELSAFLENKMLENPLLSVDESQSVLYQPKLNRSKQERSKNNFDATYWLEQASEDYPTLEALFNFTSESSASYRKLNIRGCYSLFVI